MLKLFRGDVLNNFEQIKNCRNEYQMAIKISEILCKFRLHEVDESVMALLILVYLKQRSNDLI